MNGTASLLMAATALALGTTAVSASADVTKGQCVDADAQAEMLRRDGKLSAPRQQLLVSTSSASARFAPSAGPGGGGVLLSGGL